jgi:hypothetical protein
MKILLNVGWRDFIMFSADETTFGVIAQAIANGTYMKEEDSKLVPDISKKPEIKVLTDIDPAIASSSVLDHIKSLNETISSQYKRYWDLEQEKKKLQEKITVLEGMVKNNTP